MATVTGYTATRMKQIEDNAVVGGTVTSGSLILTRNNGTTFNAGSVIGPQGPQGPQGSTGAPGYTICTSTTRPSSPTNGQAIYETDTERVYRWNGTLWKWLPGTGTDPYYLEAYIASASAAGAVGGGGFGITWGTTVTNRVGANWSGSIYTAPVSGRYRAAFFFNMGPNAAGSWQPTADVYKAGTSVGRVDEMIKAGMTTAEGLKLKGVFDLDLTSGQGLQIVAFSGGVAGTIQAGGATASRLAINLIGY